jgi:hypothetical protein
MDSNKWDVIMTVIEAIEYGKRIPRMIYAAISVLGFYTLAHLITAIKGLFG